MCPTTFKQTILVSNPPDILFSEFFKGLKESFLKQPPAQTKSCVVSLQFSKLDHPRDTGNVEETSESLEVDAETDVNDSDNTKMQIFADYEYQSLLNHFENLTSLTDNFVFGSMLPEAKWRYFCCCSSEPSPSTNVRFVLLCTIQSSRTRKYVM